MLLDKKKVGIVTKVGAVVVALAFIVTYIPMLTSGVDPTTTNPTQQSNAQMAQRITQLEKAVQADAKNVGSWITLGNAYSDYARQANDRTVLPKAVESYGKALELEPKNTDVRVDKAIAHFYMGEVATATAEGQQAVKDNPKHAKAHYNLGVFLMSQSGRELEAVKEFEEYLKIEPKGDGAAQAKQFLNQLKQAK